LAPRVAPNPDGFGEAGWYSTWVISMTSLSRATIAAVSADVAHNFNNLLAVAVRTAIDGAPP